jgi:hypothetical protein
MAWDKMYGNEFNQKIILTHTLTFFLMLLHVSAIDDEGTCELCPKNMYCFGSSVISCPTNSESPMASNSHLNCTCSDGYTGSIGGPCTACPAGTYKNQYNLSCIVCPVGTMSDTGSASCSSCPTNMTTANISEFVGDLSQCSCKEGYGFNGHGSCEACTAGQFKNTVSNSTCSTCALGSFSGHVAATECTSCLANEVTSAVGSSRCACAAGYAQNESVSTSVCTACPQGTAKGVAGDMQCMGCAVDFYTPAQASLECTMCGVNMSTVGPAAKSCACSDTYGFDASLGRCIICAAGTYKNSTSNESCSACPVSEISVAGSSKCTECAVNMHTVTSGSSMCECVQGYEMLSLDSGLCTPCAAGYYKWTTGNNICSLCPNNTYAQNVASTNCTSCVINSVTSEPAATVCSCLQGYEMNIQSGSCECAQGYENATSENVLTCKICSPGMYKSTLGNYMCRTCDRNTFSVEEGSVLCEACAVHSSTISSGQSSCLCDAGHTYEVETSACIPCVPGLFKNKTSNFQCIPCPIAKYTNTQGSLYCASCQTNTSTTSSGKTSVLDCMCGVGYGYNDSTSSCASCPVDYFKSIVNNEECIKKSVTGYYVRFRLEISITEFTQQVRQNVLNIIAGILNMDVSMLKIVSVEDLSLSSNARRLLQEESDTQVDIFVNGTDVDISLLSAIEINSIMSELYASEESAPPFVRLETIATTPFVSVTLPDTTPLHENKPLPYNKPLAVGLVVGISIGATFLVCIIVIFMAWTPAKNTNLEASVAIPELHNNVSERRLDVSNFYQFGTRPSKALHRE